MPKQWPGAQSPPGLKRLPEHLYHLKASFCGIASFLSIDKNPHPFRVMTERASKFPKLEDKKHPRTEALPNLILAGQEILSDHGDTLL
jgi:hypothetical protein